MQGIYFHIPYCLSKCRYCDFSSLGGSAAVPREYVDALLRELARLRWQLPGAPDTLYFGGGTPSLLRPAQLAQLVDAAQPAAGAEITLEANPETLTPALLHGFLAAGVNRLSLGVQTAFDESLRRMGRPHTAAQSRKALLWAHKAGFANISGDVMLALPGYTEKELTATLDLLEDGGCTHISCYLLKLEPGTPWGEAPPERLPDDDGAADRLGRECDGVVCGLCQKRRLERNLPDVGGQRPRRQHSGHHFLCPQPRLYGILPQPGL